MKVVVVRGRRETRKKNPAVANPPQINFPVGTGLEGVITPRLEPSPFSGKRSCLLQLLSTLRLLSVDDAAGGLNRPNTHSTYSLVLQAVTIRIP